MGGFCVCLELWPSFPVLELVPPAGELDLCEELHVAVTLLPGPGQGGHPAWAGRSVGPPTVTSCFPPVDWGCRGLFGIEDL